ncbi:MAG TPA: hemolysin family protein [Clostridiaceae bacterium]|nr:hemolysin family protein [Clostridiaceae bacterium]
MDSGPGSLFIELLIILILIFVNAFFSASEMAIVSINKNKINFLASEGNQKAILIARLVSEPSRFLATIQVGVTLAGFLASAFAATSISKYVTAMLESMNVYGGESISVIAVTILMSYLTLVLGELFPKRVALNNSEKIAMIVVKPVLFFSRLTKPFVKFLTFSSNILLRIVGISSEDLEEKVSEEEIRMLINVGEETGVIKETEKDMIEGIFQFDDTLAKEIMTPRTNVFTIDIKTPVNEVLDLVLSEQYSRIPVYEEDIDNVIGVLYMKDLFLNLRKSQNLNMEIEGIRDMLRPAYFVPETKNIDTLFKELQNTKNHMAMLIDEYGGFAGIVTIEDLIEEIMGNIFDEYDESDEEIKKIDQNTYLVSGLMSINDINEALHIELPSDNYDTIGGFVVNLMGSIPNENEQPVFEFEGMRFKIEKVNEKRIEKLKISLKITPEQAEPLALKE